MFLTQSDGPRNYTNQHEILFSAFRVISWIVLDYSDRSPCPKRGGRGRREIENDLRGPREMSRFLKGAVAASAIYFLFSAVSANAFQQRT